MEKGELGGIVAHIIIEVVNLPFFPLLIYNLAYFS
jgi:hypothetical protein